jgi:hypothetical protein
MLGCYYSRYIWVYIWFPSSPIAAKPWLVNPSKAWGGGVVGGGVKEILIQ